MYIFDFVEYCEIIFIRGGQCLWIVKILLVRGNVISWVDVTHEINEHWSPTNNEDSTVYMNSSFPHNNLLTYWITQS